MEYLEGDYSPGPTAVDFSIHQLTSGVFPTVSRHIHVKICIHEILHNDGRLVSSRVPTEWGAFKWKGPRSVSASITFLVCTLGHSSSPCSCTVLVATAPAYNNTTVPSTTTLEGMSCTGQVIICINYSPGSSARYPTFRGPEGDKPLPEDSVNRSLVGSAFEVPQRIQ